MYDPDSRELNKAWVEFDEWCATNNSSDLDQFIRERSLDSTIASRLRNAFLVENRIGALFSNSNSGEGIQKPHFDLTGKVDGDYRFVRRLGVGGMGTVWMADQLAPIQRQVAIKLIRPGMDSDLFLKRFEAECRALALMSHPNVAKILDAGTFSETRPYFVMEYVDGVSINEYCKQKRSSLVQRLSLFLQLCNAIQHAHQKGLLHRDIKPNNILVTEVDGKPIVKVIDFGLSKILVGDNSTNSKLTQPQTAIGSPLWMSPEQAKGGGKDDDSLDTRSDIYSLGVILYQLLTNTTPITTEFFAKASPFEVLEAIQQQVAPYPSIRLMKTHEDSDWLSHQTNSSLGSWTSMLRNDLDWVTMKALEKDRDRRYPTVTALADDVNRFLDSEPVIARPPSLGYRVRKLANKYRGTAITVGAIASLLVISTAVSGFMAYWALSEKKIAVQERSRAELERSRFEQTVDYMVLGFGKLNVSSPGVNYDSFKQDYLYSMRDEINARDFKGDLLMESSLRYPLAKSLSGSGDHKSAISEFERVVSINQEMLGEKDDLTIDAKILLATEHLRANSINEAIELAKQCQDEASRNHDSKHQLSLGAEILLNRARSLRGEQLNSIAEFKRLIKVATKELGETHEHVIDAQAGLAHSLLDKLKYKESAIVFDRARKLAEKRWGKDHKRTMELEVAYWDAQASNVEFENSSEALKTYFEKVAKKFGSGNRFTLQLRDIYGSILLRKGDKESAKAIHMESIAAGIKQLGDADVQIAITRLRLCDVWFSQRNLTEVIRILELATPVLESKLGNESQKFLRAKFMRGECYFFQEQYEKALSLAEKYTAVANENCGPDAPMVRLLQDLRARSLIECKQPEKAIPVFVTILKDAIARDGPRSLQAAEAHYKLGNAYALNLDLDEAFKNIGLSVEILRETVGMNSPDTHGVTLEFQGLLISSGNLESAEKYINHSLKHVSEKMPGYSFFYNSHRIAQADLLVFQNKFDAARTTLKKILPPVSNMPPHEQGRIKSIRGACLANNSDWENAENSLLESMEILDPAKVGNQYPWYRTTCLSRLTKLYEQWEKPDEAKKYRMMLEALHRSDN